MTTYDSLNLNTAYSQRGLDMLPQTGTTTADAAVEVCPLCDIAGCRHIRERNASAATHTDTQDIERLRKHADRGWALYTHWNARYLDCATERDRLCCARDDDGMQIMQLNARIERAEAERQVADDALVDKYRAPKSGSFNFPGDVAAIIRKLEGERDAALAQVAGAYEAAVHCVDGLKFDHPLKSVRNAVASTTPKIADLIRALTPEAATAALERLIADAVQAALAAQGEPVARKKLTDAERRKWLLDGCPELWMQKDGVGPWFIKPVQPATRYVREDLAAPASAGVTVHGAALIVADAIDADPQAFNSLCMGFEARGDMKVRHFFSGSLRYYAATLATAQSVSEGGE